MTSTTDERHDHNAHHHDEHLLSYFVNGERLRTTEQQLTVREVLTDSGFTPVEDYRLARDADHHVFDHYGAEVKLHEGERFTATFHGPTPTS